MQEIILDFSRNDGKMKPMHAVNNGPVYKFAADQRVTNMHHFKAAGIPYARNHDASLNYSYGANHVVDVNNIFTNFDADPYDPASYDFVCTDYLMRVMEESGAKTFYRLGASIEHHAKKYNTLPPKDFKKWAVICEHIIRHYTEGWADGFHYDIEYWEIWNEPNLDPDDSPNKRCWGGTKKQFFELYDIAATHLKKCFPHLKIGGPALASPEPWAHEFLAQLKAPLDFLSWHVYAHTEDWVINRVRTYRKMLDDNGFTKTESILNEWNYVKSWLGDDWLYTLRQEKSIKGAAFIGATMCACQAEPLDMLMYYDARPGGMNGMFNTDRVCETLKGYYPFFMFNKLYQAGTFVLPEYVTEPDENKRKVFACAAKGDEKHAMLAYFDDDDTAGHQIVKIKLKNVGEDAFKARVYMLDKNRDNELIKEEVLCGAEPVLRVRMNLHSVCHIEILPA